ncbi:MAG: hypothetical protein GQ569_10805 [Methylococcaceae bacterium]|nr:hypothetical protein [Methylococcaceae bacterium]
MSCCDDPTEPSKIEARELQYLQVRHGDLLRDLFTSDPEKVLLKQLNQANHYLRELAALNGHYQSLRLHAIELLEKDSISVLQQVITKYPESAEATAAQNKIALLENPTNPLKSLINYFHHE